MVKLNREYDQHEVVINSLQSFSDAVDFYSDLKSKIQIIEQDNLSFYIDYMKSNRITIAINSNEALLNKQQLEKLDRLRKNGCVVGVPLGNNKVTAALNSSGDGRDNFSKLVNGNPSDSFKEWFSLNFKAEVSNDPEDGDDFYITLTIL